MSRFTRILKISTGVCSVGLISYLNREKFESKIFAASPILQTPLKERSQWDSNWDCRKYSDDYKTEDGQKKKRLSRRYIILIRHGQYHLEGKTDAEHKLTTLGREQARMTGARLKELGIPFTRIIHSTMTRARETAEIIHEALPEVPMTHCSLLEEGCPIEPEPPSKHWRPPYYFHQDGARIEAAFRKYFHRADPSQESDSYEIIVCHGNVIRYFVCRALQLPPEAWLRFSLRHASLTSLVIDSNGKVSLRSYGDAGYMPPHALTTS